jgi:solute:Na+ symporter, SSS family
VMSCYEWLGIMVMIVVAIFVLPKYLRAGINTLPEYLEYRYNATVRLVVSIAMFVCYVFLTISGMLYANVLVVETFCGFHSEYTYWYLGAIAAVMAVAGGLKTIVRLEVVFAIVMLGVGILIAVFSVIKIGGFAAIVEAAPQKMHSLLPSSDPDLPWHSIILGGFWFGALFYFGFNQYMMQKLFSTHSLSTAQKGFMLTATLKIIIPFIIVLPAIIAFVLYSDIIKDPDSAYPMLAFEVLPVGFKGLFYCMMFAAVFGSFISILNSASTVFSLDVYKRFLNKNVSESQLVLVGRLSIVIVLVVACVWAPHIKNFGGVFVYIKKNFGYVYPAVIVIFLAGWASRKVSPMVALVVICANPILFWIYLKLTDGHAFLTTIAYVTISLALIAFILTLMFPWKRHFVVPDKGKIKFERNLVVFMWGIVLFSSSLALLVVFI